MNIVSVEQLLAQHRAGADPLSLKRLTALTPTPAQYSVLLCQPHGTLHESAARIGNSKSASVVPMYRGFLEHAVVSQAQLVVTPEYSVPWELIRNVAIVSGAPRPPHGAIWALGCESITPDELDAFQSAVADNTGVRLIHEPFDSQKRAQAAFIDPLVFIFWTIDKAGADVLCLLIQFKTLASTDLIEQTSLYLGTSVYKFSAHPGDVSLLALICSDAFSFTDALVSEHCTNLLLLHIQLNQRPGHGDYAAYRSRFVSVASNNNVEILCLNWAANVLIEGNGSPWNPIAGSAWYVAPRGVVLTDTHVNQLHHDGIYYSVVGERWHAFYLNYAPHSILLRKQPVFAAGPQVVAPRLPPLVVVRRAWNPVEKEWKDVAADDGFSEFIKTYAPLPTTLPALCGQDPLAVERALELLEGPQGHVSDWHSLKELRALRIADEESLRRVTVSQETDPARQGVILRRARVRRAQTAVTIPGQPVTWPTPVADLAVGFRYRWSSSQPHANVEPLAGGQPAALIYLGEDPEADTVKNVYAKMKKARELHAYATAVQEGVEPGDRVTVAQDRLCVSYRANHVIRFYRPGDFGSITDASGAQPDDLTGEHS